MTTLRDPRSPLALLAPSPIFAFLNAACGRKERTDGVENLQRFNGQRQAPSRVRVHEQTWKALRHSLRIQMGRRIEGHSGRQANLGDSNKPASGMGKATNELLHRGHKARGPLS